MPSPYTTPYVPREYDRGPTMRIADLLREGGDARARAMLQSSALWGQAIQQLGQIPGQIIEGRAMERESKARAEDRQAQTAVHRLQLKAAEDKQRESAEFGELLGSGRTRGEVLKSLEGKPDLYEKALKHYGSMDDNWKRVRGGIAASIREFKDDPQAAMIALADAEEQGYDPRQLAEIRKRIQSDPASISPLVDTFLSQSPDETHRALVRKAAKLEEVSPGATLYDPTRGAAVFTAPVAEKQDQARVVGRSLVGPGGEVIYRDPETGDKNEPRLWVKRGDQVLRIKESEYQPGDVPTSTREQGRPVTSGDAGRISDLDTSLDDLNTLGATLSGSKATGAAAKAGAMLPNFISEVTGLGVDAKQKQATIDRVKQVIGKALEGGVLRKEDEYKYEKILPTIGDPPEVVKTKLTGLWNAIEKRKQTTIDALADAGYDTSKFESRAPRSRTGEKKADPLGIR